MRLVIVSLMGGLQWGGSEALWHSLAACALSQNDKVFVSIYDWGKLHPKVQELKEKGAIINTRKRYNAAAGLGERITRFIKKRKPSLDKDYQSIIDFGPDIVFISQGDSFDLAIHHRPLYELLQTNGLAYLIVCHNHEQYSFVPPKEIFPNAVEIFQNAQRVYFVSHRQWKLTERRIANKILNGCFTWNPLNIELPQVPLEWPQKSHTCFAMVASLGGPKGHDTIFEVFSSANWKKRNWHLNIYGAGYGKDYLQALASFFGIEERITFHGHVNDIVGIWQKNHLLLIPSAAEGLPISLVEAMFCGRPAIATDVGGNSELVIDDETGFLAPSPATHHFSDVMEKAWRRREDWEDIGKAAHELVQEKYEKQPHKQLYEQLQKIALNAVNQDRNVHANHT